MKHLLIENSGSSSLKFSIFKLESDKLQPTVSGIFSGIATTHGHFRVEGNEEYKPVDENIALPDQASAAARLMDWLRENTQHGIDAVGHRVVHGGRKFVEPCRIDDDLISALRSLSRFAPLHLPPAIAAIESSLAQFPNIPQAACFDTSFHRSMPEHARMLPLTKELFFEDGVEKFGFHGISYEAVLSKLAQRADLKVFEQNLIIAHLGNGCSMAAIKNGQSIETTMSFSPTAGLVMGTRSGDIDPGLISYFAREKKMSAEDFVNFANTKSGLLGLSGISSDMQELLAKESTSEDAKRAIEIFCYHARNYIGYLAAALGGLDMLVFTGGIGEHSSIIRQRICTGLEFLGVSIDQSKNENSQELISSNNSKTKVLVIATNEELMIAKHCVKLFHL